MTAYFNEIDPYAAAWLQNLMLDGAIAPGHVDTRSIEDVTPNDLAGYTQCHFFAGIGVWSAALRLAGWPDDKPVWTGSCPCQPFSQAGKGGGAADERHLWPAWFHLIELCRPPVVFGEQVASPDGLAWLDTVHGDMERAGYAFGPKDLCAAGVGAPHIRQRTYFVADRGMHERGSRWASEANEGAQQLAGCGDVGFLADHHQQRREGLGLSVRERRSLTPGAEAGRRGEARELGDASSSRGGRNTGAVPRTEGSLERGVRCLIDVLEPAGAVDDLGDTHHQGLPLRQISDDGGRVVRLEGAAAGPAEPVRGFWSGADWIACRDGKWRPVEPGTFPLAHGAPARVGRLRAYGNAIVAPLAAEFIGAYMDVA